MVVSVTRVPSVGVAGGVAPGVRRIITPVKSASVGFTQDRATDDAVALEETYVTGAGGVMSGGGAVVVVLVAGAAWLGTASWAKRA